MKKITGKHILYIVLTLIAIGFFSMTGGLIETVKADEIVVIQDPIDGDLHFYFDPGMKFQKFGAVTRYKKESQYWFSTYSDQGSPIDQSIRIRFNDGANASISGSVRWKMPTDEYSMKNLHTMYGSQKAVEQQLVRTVIEKAVYMTGPLMSSKESYAERRNDLISFIYDQATEGVYRTISKEVKGLDPLSGREKTFSIVEIVRDSGGVYLRQEISPLHAYNVDLYNLSLNTIKYDKTVETQIEQQQNAIMQVQTAIAKAKEAEQDAIRAEKEGQAKAAQAKWEQEVVKAQRVTEAQQKKEVAQLEMEAAEFYKKEQILRGEGDAARKKLEMQADGALEKKLNAYIQVNQAYATAIKEYKGNWVPGVVMGGSGGGSKSQSVNGANDLVNLLMVKTASDLSLDLSVPQGNNR